MTSGNGAEQPGEEPAAAERSDEEPAVGPNDRSSRGRTKDSVDGEDSTVDPAPAESADRPRKSRRKPGVEYWPV
ncbi:hypothetical protein ACGFWD_44210 [Streptomyces sp. NPDC048448]|uniref:hypothetical protein n=1 Tax=unclassified Streptomyces TaxID=2593676 RepID=UPI00143E7E5F|nr:MULTISPECIES: hypothetical protein [unclassified Streptomyces]QIY66709.1 hypothetical protein HEP85_41230 [Streptomyces sp. RPA4-2]